MESIMMNDMYLSTKIGGYTPACNRVALSGLDGWCDLFTYIGGYTPACSLYALSGLRDGDLYY